MQPASGLLIWEHKVFEYTFSHWVTFLSVAMLLNLSPGPDIAFILGQTIGNGRQQGFAAMFGIWSGTAVHVTMAAVGISAILATSALAFSIVKWLGAAYLTWLGIRMLLSRGNSFIEEDSGGVQSSRSIYWQGVLTSVLNPKVAIFFLAFLPQFVVDGAGAVGAQLFLHGSLIIVIAAFVEPPLILIGSRLGKILKRSHRAGLWMDRGLGLLFVTLGLRLAFSSR